MTLAELMELVRSDIPVGTGSFLLSIVLIACTMIEVIPVVKFKPWSWIVKKVGSIANENITQRLDVIEKDITMLKEENAEQDEREKERDALNARREILKFADSLRHGTQFSRESYEQIMIDIDNYERYSNSHPDFMNNRTKAAQKKILSEFDVRDASNDFLN